MSTKKAFLFKNEWKIENYEANPKKSKDKSKLCDCGN